MLDFNEADAAPLPDRSAQRDAVRAALIARIDSVLSVLFQAGKKRKGLFLIGDVLGSPGDSLEVVLTGETDPLQAVHDYVAGIVKPPLPHEHGHGHEHGHAHAQDHAHDESH